MEYHGKVTTDKAILHITRVYPNNTPKERFIADCDNIINQFVQSEIVVTPINITVIVEQI